MHGRVPEEVVVEEGGEAGRERGRGGGGGGCRQSVNRTYDELRPFPSPCQTARKI